MGFLQITDALMKLNVPYGGFLPDIVMYGPERQAGNTKLIGPAYTIKVNNYIIHC